MLQKARELALASGSCRHSYITFLSDIFVNVIREIFISKTKLDHSEATFNEAAIWPVLKFALYSMTRNNRELKFYPGEDRLRSMSVQLEVNRLSADNRSCYKADAILRCSEPHQEMEVLLLETSNAYNSADKPKISFDFHKGLFGALSMLKTIADHHQYADFKTMAKLRVYFVHAHTKHIRLWSISCPSQGVFVVYREDKCAIPTSFRDDQKILLDYIRFTWALKVSNAKAASTIFINTAVLVGSFGQHYGDAG
ncbi:hypothetical protein BJV82DRAFT_397951 [Fennellomyces sp. T-0311]|nr:hypothetical protein BJV82DRAFT_397951 [Fennellomyces sp. T-0311]